MICCADSFMRPVDPRQRTFVRDIADKRGKAVCTGSEAADRHTATAVHVGGNASSKLAFASKRGATMSKRLAGQVKRLSVTGPSPCGRRATTATARLARRFMAVHLPGTMRGLARATCPLSAAQPSRPFGRNADRAERREERNTAVRDVKHDVRELERLLRRRRQQLSIWPQLTLPFTSRPRKRTPRATTR